MLPYIPNPTLDLGFYRLEAFPVLVGAAVVAEFQIVLHRAPRYGISRETASTLAGWAILLGIVGAHLFELFVYEPERFLKNPLEILMPWHGISSLGGMLGGLLGLLWVMRRRAMSALERLRFVDCLMFALPFTLAIGRAGCALQHDHLGISSSHWLAVAFPGGPRFDLGLLEFLYVSLMCIAFLAANLWRLPDGFYIGLFFTLYGPVRFLLDALRVGDVRYFGWTPAQYLSLFATGVGLAILASVLLRRPRAVSPS